MVAKMLFWKLFPWQWIIYLHLSIYCFAEPEPSDPSSRRFQPLQGNPRITDHPEDGYFARNDPATLDCQAEGTPPPTVTWYKDGKLVETNQENPLSHRMLLDNGQLFFLMVIHSKNGDSDIGQYYCNATNSHGSAISNTANIQIAVLKGEFKEEPVDTTTAVGQTVVFHCKPPRGKPEPKVIWNKNGEILHPTDRIGIREDGDLVINDVEKRDMGEYICLATNTGGEKQSKPAQLTVLDIPVFHKLPKDISINEGKDAIFYCDVVGDPPIKIKWSKNGGLINYGRARILSNKTLCIEKVEPGDEGVYECTAENAAGSTKASARLVVLSPPSFLIRPKDQVVAKGRTVTLQCVAKGNPPPTVFWRKDSQDNLMFPNRDSGGRISVAEDGTFRIEAVNESDAGTYICEALNTKGQVSAEARIRVVDGPFHLPEHDPRPPPIIKIGPQNQTLPADTVGMLRCMVGGNPHPIVRWYKDGRPVAMTGPRYTLLDSGTLQISDLMVQDSGTYTCKAISETGETNWSAFLLVDGAGSFTPVRSSAASALPDPPTKPVVSDVTDTSVHLSWAPGVQVGPSPVFAFYVQYFGYETTDGWITASTNVKRESYTVEKLRPNTSYVFMVRAVNSEGAGPPSLISEPIRTLAKKQDRKSAGVLSEDDIKRKLGGKVVELTNTQSLNASAISLTWKVLKSDDIIEGFQIEYRNILDIRRLDYGKVYSVRVPPTLSSFTLTGLSSYSWYELCVLAFSNKVKSRCSSPVKVQTEENYTPGPPEVVQVDRVSDTSVAVSWKSPKMKKGRLIVTGYQISCVSKDKKDNCSVMTNGRTLRTVIKQLRRNKEYVIRVAADTHLGMSSWSDAFIFSKGDVYPAGKGLYTSTLKPITNKGPEEVDLFKKPWFLGLLIGTVGVMLWLILCIFSIWLCKKKKNKKKMKDQRFYTGVPLKADEHNRNMMYPPQYGIKDPQINFSNDLDLPPELCVLLPHGKKEQEIREDNIYKMAGDGSFPEMKTFYQKQDVAPYATTALIQKQHMMKQRQQGLDHMFRPINQGYMHYSEGSGDSCQKQPLSVDSNHDNSRGSTTDHNHSDNMQSPTSDSGSHTTDENGLLIKEKKRSSTKKEAMTPKQVVVNWSDMLPPPPDHPPPSECGEPPLYSEIRSADEHSSARSPVSPVSFSQLSACSCPNPHTQTPVSGWNVPMYSDNDCPRCHSEKYYDPATYCQEPYVKRTHSPRTHLLQHVNANRNPQNNFNAHSPRGTPNVIYQYSQPQRGLKSNFATLHGERQSSVNRASHSSHSDNEAPNTTMPCFHSYKINPKSEKDYRFLREKESCPEPAPPCHQCGNDSGMGMEEDGMCMDQACQSSLPSVAVDCLNNSLYRPHNVMSSSAHSGYGRTCDSPVSEGADYATESDLDQASEHSQNWNVPVDQNTDCSSVRSSTCSSGDGTFLTEADFASAVARAAEMSGLTVIGTTVCDPQPKKKERRHRRPARPVSPGYSTDSNYGSIDVVHRPYPKSERKKQLMEQGKIRGHQRVNDIEGQMSRSLHSENGLPNQTAEHIPRNIPVDNTVPVYDTPYGRAHYVISNPVSPLSPTRLTTLKFIPPPNGSTGYERGGYSGYLQQNSVQPIREDVV